jgi:hypothetical protein
LLFHEDAIGAEADRFADLIFFDVRAQDDGAWRVRLTLQLAQHLDAVRALHDVVENQDVGPLPAHEAGHIVAAHAATDDVDVTFRTEQLFECIEDERMVIGQNDADGGHGWGPERTRADETAGCAMAGGRRRCSINARTPSTS